MTTVILVSIGILLAAIAALFVIFYGGDAFGSSSVKTEAARLVVEGQQISDATDLFYRQEDRLPGQGKRAPGEGEVNPDPLKDLSEMKYLPIAPVGAKLTSEARPWKMEYGTDGMIYSSLGAKDDKTSNAVCKEARRQVQLSNPDKIYQCDGSDYPDATWGARGTLPDREPCCIRK